MADFKVKGKQQVAWAQERFPALSDYEGVQVTINDENGGWLYSCDVGVPGSLILQLRNQGRWSQDLKVRLLRQRIEQILDDSIRLPTGPIPNLNIDGQPIFLVKAIDLLDM